MRVSRSETCSTVNMSWIGQWFRGAGESVWTREPPRPRYHCPCPSTPRWSAPSRPSGRRPDRGGAPGQGGEAIRPHRSMTAPLRGRLRDREGSPPTSSRPDCSIPPTFTGSKPAVRINRSTSKHILRHISAPWNRHLEPARCRSRAYESEDQIDLRKGTNAQLRHRRHS
jgi:hypothetical protein